MQEALPYKSWVATTPATTTRRRLHGASDDVAEMVAENPVIVFGRRGCCMCHVLTKLLLGLGVNPPVYEIEDEAKEVMVVNALTNVGVAQETGTWQFPVVFVGGKWFGGLEKVVAAHISGELVPILRQAGALWL